MVWTRAARSALAIVWILGSGCSSLKEIPRSEFGARSERKNVRLTTLDGRVYEFDYIQVAGDSLTGYKRRDTEGAVDDYASLRLALADLASVSARSVDWYRTGLIGGGVIAAVAVAGLSHSSSDSSEPPSSPGGPGRGP